MKYLLFNGCALGKKQLVDSIEEAIKACDKKNKTCKYKWLVYELPEDEVEKYEKFNRFNPSKCKVVYDPTNVRNVC